MLGFTYYTPTKVAFGKGSVEKVGELMKQFGGTRVLIHYGGQSAVRSGVLDRVKKSLDEAGIFHVELGGVVPNPHLAKVREGIELSKANGVDFLLAVGGGSVIDSCKAIAYGLAEPEHDVWELYAGQRKAKACFPVASVLTIAAVLFGFQVAIGNIQTLPGDVFHGKSVGSLAGVGGMAAVAGTSARSAAQPGEINPSNLSMALIGTSPRRTAGAEALAH